MRERRVRRHAPPDGRRAAPALLALLATTVIASATASAGSAASAKPPSKATLSACSKFKASVLRFAQKGLAPLKVQSATGHEHSLAVLKQTGAALKHAAHPLALEIPTAHKQFKQLGSALETFEVRLKRTGPHGNFTLVLAPVEHVLRAAEPIERICEYDLSSAH